MKSSVVITFFNTLLIKYFSCCFISYTSVIQLNLACTFSNTQVIKDELYLKCCTFSNTPIKEFIYSGCFIVLKASDIKWCLVYYTTVYFKNISYKIGCCILVIKVLKC